MQQLAGHEPADRLVEDMRPPQLVLPDHLARLPVDESHGKLARVRRHGKFERLRLHAKNIIRQTHEVAGNYRQGLLRRGSGSVLWQSALPAPVCSITSPSAGRPARRQAASGMDNRVADGQAGRKVHRSDFHFPSLHDLDPTIGRNPGASGAALQNRSLAPVQEV